MDLLPCPFCGGPATMDRACLVRDTYYWVTCRNELCAVKCHGLQSLTERDAVAAWNTRATPTPPPQASTVRPDMAANSGHFSGEVRGDMPQSAPSSDTTQEQ